MGPRFKYVATFFGRNFGPPNWAGIVARIPMRAPGSAVGCRVGGTPVWGWGGQDMRSQVVVDVGGGGERRVEGNAQRVVGGGLEHQAHSWGPEGAVEVPELVHPHACGQPELVDEVLLLEVGPELVAVLAV